MIPRSAYDYVIEWEGDKLTDDPDDPGGTTKYGITIPLLKQLGFDVDGDSDIDSEDILRLSEQTSLTAYNMLWGITWCDQMQSKNVNSHLVTKFFDTTVNLGFYQSTLILQRALNNMYFAHRLVLDGKFGPKTLSAMSSHVGIDSVLRLAYSFSSEQAGIYRLITYKHPTMKKYLAGWLRRAYSTPFRVITTTDQRYLN